MDLAQLFERAWDFVQWFANMVIGTVASSILGGWVAVVSFAAVIFMLFLFTRMMNPPGDD